MIKSMVCGLAVAAGLLGAAPALAQSAGVWDPIEPVNRGIWEFNNLLRGAVYAPVAETYREYVPPAVQTGIDNVFTNLREPVTAIGSVVAGDLENAKLSAGRFVINLTLGIGGIYDVATAKGWTPRPTDFGTALCKLEVPAGPYIVLPFVGPSTLRDTAGLAATYALALDVADDWGWTYIVVDRAVARASNPPPAVDDYAQARDAYSSFRGSLCDDALPAGSLKASPLGQTVAAGSS
jgi:phospholipid-binding lipoprotein MlaA